MTGTDNIRELIQRHFKTGGEDLHSIASGFFSRAYAFTADSQAYVIRLNDSTIALEGFINDDYAWRHFGSQGLPIPRIVAIGEFESGCYAISERAPGRLLRECSATERQAVLPSLLNTLEIIGQADVSASHGYGYWDSNGNGPHTSWQAFLAETIENDTDGYYQDWHELYARSFLERDVYEAVYHRMMQLAVFCPEERALVHNDFHFDNILSDGQEITAVVDWANALYGDPLYDVAWLTWQSAHPGWWYENGIEILRDRFGAAPNYDERIACYECYIGLDHLRFYAKNGKREGYDFCRIWLMSLLETSARLL